MDKTAPVAVPGKRHDRAVLGTNAVCDGPSCRGGYPAWSEQHEEARRRLVSTIGHSVTQTYDAAAGCLKLLISKFGHR
jgi:hypothetical protein